MRAFLSYDIDDPDILSKVASLQKELALSRAGLKLVNPDILHFTTRFLGEISEDQKERIISAIEGKVELLDIAVTFLGVGAFPSKSRISVIWMGIDTNSAKIIGEQARVIDLRLQGIGPFHEDSHGFSPHLTIARVRSSNRPLFDFMEKHRDEEFGSCKIGPLRLKLSKLVPRGPEYSDLHVFQRKD